ncbi:MAG: hypothetical protein K1X35_14430 [Caulobacteraceae bacterium]|nr:hypothetical protein [Caulobacteraceae bacterium]
MSNTENEFKKAEKRIADLEKKIAEVARRREKLEDELAEATRRADTVLSKAAAALLGGEEPDDSSVIKAQARGVSLRRAILELTTEEEGLASELAGAEFAAHDARAAVLAEQIDTQLSEIQKSLRDVISYCDKLRPLTGEQHRIWERGHAVRHAGIFPSIGLIEANVRRALAVVENI